MNKDTVLVQGEGKDRLRIEGSERDLRSGDVIEVYVHGDWRLAVVDWRDGIGGAARYQEDVPADEDEGNEVEIAGATLLRPGLRARWPKGR